eukprot:PITA_30356
MTEPPDENSPSFYVSLTTHDKILHNCLLDTGANDNLMPKAVMDELGLDITRPYHDLFSFDSRKVKCLGLIKDLAITLAQLPMKSMMMDIVVANVPPKFDMLLSRGWIKRLGGTLQKKYVLCYCPSFWRILVGLHAAQENCLSDHGRRRPTNLDMFFDGACSREVAGAGVVLVSPTQECIHLSFKMTFKVTNNIAEYEALILGLNAAKEIGIKHLKVFGDANLIIQQVNKTFQARHPRLKAYRDEEYSDLKTYDKNIIQHKIPLEKDTIPFKQKLRPISPLLLPLIEKEIKKLLTAKIIARYSKWIANLVVVRNKNGEFRLCVDFRNLNKCSKKDNYPLPKMEHLLQKVSGARVMSFLDSFSGYNQVVVHPEDQEKTTFTTPWGTFMYSKMPF